MGRSAWPMAANRSLEAQRKMKLAALLNDSARQVLVTMLDWQEGRS